VFSPRVEVVVDSVDVVLPVFEEIVEVELTVKVEVELGVRVVLVDVVFLE